MNDEAFAWETGYVALDIETTGLSPRSCSIIEVGALKFVPGKKGEDFSSLIDPGCPIPASGRSIHGITDDMVAGQPRVEEVIAGLLDFVGPAPLVLHNAPFDLSFIAPVLDKLGRKWQAMTVFDTLPLSRVAFPGLRSYSLESLSDFFEFKEGVHHRALCDCWYTQQLFTRFLEKVDQLRCLELADLAHEYGDFRLLTPGTCQRMGPAI